MAVDMLTSKEALAFGFNDTRLHHLRSAYPEHLPWFKHVVWFSKKDGAARRLGESDYLYRRDALEYTASIPQIKSGAWKETPDRIWLTALQAGLDYDSVRETIALWGKRCRWLEKGYVLSELKWFREEKGLRIRQIRVYLKTDLDEVREAIIRSAGTERNEITSSKAWLSTAEALKQYTRQELASIRHKLLAIRPGIRRNPKGGACKAFEVTEWNPAILKTIKKHTTEPAPGRATEKQAMGAPWHFNIASLRKWRGTLAEPGSCSHLGRPLRATKIGKHWEYEIGDLNSIKQSQCERIGIPYQAPENNGAIKSNRKPGPQPSDEVEQRQKFYHDLREQGVKLDVIVEKGKALFGNKAAKDTAAVVMNARRYELRGK